MNLNPVKSAFGVDSVKFLGFMFLENGTKANPKQIGFIMNMLPPQNINEIQRLVGWIVVLNRFISRSMEECMSFFKVLREANS